MTLKRVLSNLIVVWAALVIGFAPGRGRGQSASDLTQLFTKTDVMIPMRDGVRLHTEIYAPRNASESAPFLLARTPYGINTAEPGYSPGLSSFRHLTADGYVIVLQDIRGRFQSDGEFVMLRPPRDRRDPKAVDESTDTNDTIEWLLKNVPNNNGRVGLVGTSYGGWLTVMGLIDPHPALKATMEQASPADMFLGDDFHHNGAFRLDYGFGYAVAMESSKGISPFDYDIADAFEWYLRLGPLSNVNPLHLQGKIPTWNNFVAHPNYDEFWQKQGCAPYLDGIALKPANLNVAGWWDQEDFYGPLEIYKLLEKHDTDHKNYLIVGPWNHGGWSRADGSSLGPVQFGINTSEFFREQIQRVWFAYWLKDNGSLPFSEAMTFETGSNQWKTWDAWPPEKNAVRRKLYLHEGGLLSFDPPGADAADASDSYVSDPDHPVPYRQRPINPTFGRRQSTWPIWLVDDQRFADLRPDTLSWRTDFLKEDVAVAGDIVAHLFASTSGTDSDWIVKLIDIYPENDAKMAGYQLMIADEVFRGRFLRSFSKPEPLVPNQPTGFTIDLHTNDHTFLKGHRIMVQVQSTWFPLIDRNPQTFVPNIFLAGPKDFRKATQHIYRSSKSPSSLELPVIVR